MSYPPQISAPDLSRTLKENITPPSERHDFIWKRNSDLVSEKIVRVVKKLLPEYKVLNDQYKHALDSKRAFQDDPFHEDGQNALAQFDREIEKASDKIDDFLRKSLNKTSLSDDEKNCAWRYLYDVKNGTKTLEYPPKTIHYPPRTSLESPGFKISDADPDHIKPPPAYAFQADYAKTAQKRF